MDVIISGQITAVLPAQQGVSQRTGQPWVSQEYVLCHEPGQYPKSVCFRVFGEDKIKQMNIQMGETLTAHLNIDAKQGQKGYFNSIDCWKVERQQMGGYQQQPYPQPAPVAYPQTGQAPFPPQPTTAPQPSPFPPQPAGATGPATAAPTQTVAQPQGGQLPFPPAQ
jgi:hypothetical protein